MPWSFVSVKNGLDRLCCSNGKSIELHVEIFDEDLMNDMLEKLKVFYYKALLPEIVVPRHRKFPGIREPGVWVR